MNVHMCVCVWRKKAKYSILKYCPRKVHLETSIEHPKGRETCFTMYVLQLSLIFYFATPRNEGLTLT